EFAAAGPRSVPGIAVGSLIFLNHRRRSDRLPRPSCCGVPPWSSLACACFPKAVVLWPRTDLFTGLSQRSSPIKRSVRGLGERPWSALRSRRGRPPPFSDTRMQVTFAYWKRSAIVPDPTGLAIALAPNLSRERVSYLGTLRQPVRFREAI